jgi:capsid protein
MKALLYGPDSRPLRVKAFYEGARTAKTRSAVAGINQSVHLDLNRATRRELMRKSRYFYKNSPMARGIIERLVTYVVGTGLMPIPETSSENFNTQAMENFLEWCKYCDLENNHNFFALQAVIFGSQLIDGDHFTLKTFGNSGRPRLQLIESHQIGSEWDFGPQMIEGVELDSYGRPNRYRYRAEVPNHWFNDPGFEAIDAEDLIAHYKPIRAHQQRGEPILSSAINTVHDVDDILALEKAAVKDASSKTDIIKTRSGELNRTQGDYIGMSVKGSDGEDLSKYYSQVFNPEAKVLREGDEFTPYIPQRPSNAWQGFMDFLAHRSAYRWACLLRFCFRSKWVERIPDVISTWRNV